MCGNVFLVRCSRKPPLAYQCALATSLCGRAETPGEERKKAVSALTIEALKEILNEAAGEDDSFKAGQDILDTPFLELGFDSLALLETVALIKRRYGVGVGGAAFVGHLMRGSTKLAFLMTWHIPLITLALTMMIIVIASLFSLWRVLRVEPAIVFKG